MRGGGRTYVLKRRVSEIAATSMSFSLLSKRRSVVRIRTKQKLGGKRRKKRVEENDI